MSNKLPSLDLFRNVKALKYATGLALASIVLAGCGKDIKPKTTNEDQVDPDPRIAALHKFRQDITKKGQARFFMGACVAWPNQDEGLTVTINPGIAEVETGENFLVFTASHKQKSKKLEATLMDGPEIGDPRVLTLAFNPNIKKGSPDTVKGKLVRRKNGQVTYVDEVSGKTLANTAILPDTPPVVEIVEETCTALRKDQKIPEVSVIDLPEASESPAI